MKKIKTLHFYILFCFVILLLLSLFMRFAINTRTNEFLALQNKAALGLTNNTAKQIEQYILSQHHLLDLFIASQKNNIQQLTASPNTNANLESIRKSAKQNFGTYKQLFIVDSSGTPLSTGLSSPIGGTCAADVRLYAKSPHLQKLFIHNSANIGKHIDIINGIPGSEYFIFIALDVAKIYSIIKPEALLHFSLSLLKNDGSDSIELEHLLNNNLLTQNNPKFIFEKNITGTHWKVRSIVSQQKLDDYKNRLFKRAASMWVIIFFVCLGFLWRLNIGLKDKKQIKNQLILLNENLETNIITRTKELQKSLFDLTYQTEHDYLTGLLSRHIIETIIQDTISSTHKKPPFLLVFSLDDFKLVNETSSHSAGDELLKQVSKIFSQVVSKNSTLARIGSDEFAVILNNHESLDDALKAAEKLSQSTETLVFEWHKRLHRVGLSVAIIPLLAKVNNLEHILSIADTALGFAKKSKTNKIYVYDENSSKVLNHQKKLLTANAIIDDITNKRFVLYAHKITPLQNPIHFNWTEVLLRKQAKSGKLVLPDDFIPIAEEFNRIDNIDFYVIEQSLNWLKEIKQATRININLSGKTLSNVNLIPFIEKHIIASKVNASDICFEITETASIDNMQYAINFIAAMKSLGCLTALDDFGTGLSSLFYLKRLDVDFVKIDGEFIKDICHSKSDLVMVKSITQICKTLNKITIAEYVEDQETADLLTEIGVDFAQGFLYHKPEPLN